MILYNWLDIITSLSVCVCVCATSGVYADMSLRVYAYLRVCVYPERLIFILILTG